MATDEPTDPGRGKNNKVIVTYITTRGEMMTRIINIYVQRAVRTEDRQVWKVNCHRII